MAWIRSSQCQCGKIWKLNSIGLLRDRALEWNRAEMHILVIFDGMMGYLSELGGRGY